MTTTDKLSRDQSVLATADTQALAEAFCAWPLPASVCSDPCATMPGYPNRSGTNLITVAEAKAMFDHLVERGLLQAPRTGPAVISDRAKSIVTSTRRQNVPVEPGLRLVGYVVPSDIAGMSEALFALEEIRHAALAACADPEASSSANLRSDSDELATPIQAFAKSMANWTDADVCMPDRDQREWRHALDEVRAEMDPLWDAVEAYMHHTGSTERNARRVVLMRTSKIARMALAIAEMCGWPEERLAGPAGAR